MNQLSLIASRDIARSNMISGQVPGHVRHGCALHAFLGELDKVTNAQYRGLAEAWGDPALQGGADFAYNIFYAGIWALEHQFRTPTTGSWDARPASARSQTSPTREVDRYGGIAPIWKNSPFGDVTFNLGFHLLLLSGEPTLPRLLQRHESDIDYLEGKAGYSVAWKQIKDLTTGETLTTPVTAIRHLQHRPVLDPESTASYTLSHWGP